RRHVFLPIVHEALSFRPLSLWRNTGITRGGFWTAIDRGDTAVANLARGAAHSRPTRQGFRLRINAGWSLHLDDRTSGARTTELTGPARCRPRACKARRNLSHRSARGIARRRGPGRPAGDLCCDSRTPAACRWLQSRIDQLGYSRAESHSSALAIGKAWLSAKP